MSDLEPANLCLEVLYTGHVQGVGFRWTTSRIARRHAVAGYVRNEPDGTVRLFVQGPEAPVRAFLGEVASTMSAHIVRVETTEAAFRDDLAGFKIRR